MLRLSATPRPDVSPGPIADESPELLGRIEAWVASNLDSPADSGGAGELDGWNLRAIALLDPQRDRKDVTREALKAGPAWNRIAVAKKSGATVVRLRDRSLVKETDLSELFDEVMDLIESGHRRLAIDFSNVERMSCLIVPLLARAARRCEEDGEGLLKVFNLRPEIAPILELGPSTHSFCTPDEPAALGGPWPERTGPRRLPLAMLAGLTANLRLVAGHDLTTNRPEPPAMPRDPEDVGTDPASTLPSLMVDDGRSPARRIPLGAREAVIGRDEPCEIRFHHAQVSRRHASVRTDGRRVWFRDLDSSNGTTVNDHPLGRQEVEVRAGDRVQIGPFAFTIATAEQCVHVAIDEDQIVGWLGGGAEEEGAAVSTFAVTSCDLPTSSRPVRVEVIQDVLVLTPIEPNYLNATDSAAIRAEFAEMLASYPAKRIVLNLEHVARLSNATIGVLVAFHLRLERAGGSMRLCQPHARVAQVLDQIRLNLLMDVFSTKEDAVLSAWTREDREAV